MSSPRTYGAVPGLLWMVLTGLTPAAAQHDEAPDDVMAAFDRVSLDAIDLTFSAADLDLPPGGHIQGIQFRYDADNDRFLAFLSHDSRTHGYVVVVAFTATLDSPGEVIHVHRFEKGRLRHAGGIQLSGDLLVVGLEDNWKKDFSEVQFWSVSDPLAWQRVLPLTLRRRGPPKAWTAGAVGLVAGTDGAALAVGNWDCRDIDVFRSTHVDLRHEECRFTPVGRWSVKDADISDWSPDSEFGSYQAINLIRQTDGQLFLAGFHQAGRDRDVADLFELDLSAEPHRLLRKVATKQIKLSDDVHFKYGGGLFFHQGALWLLATQRSLDGTVHINLAR